MTIKIPYTYIEQTTAGLLDLSPSGDGLLNLSLFNQAVTQFLSEHSEFEAIAEHRSSQSPNGDLDHVILKLSEP